MHFTANFWRFRPIDFNEHSVLGDIPGASLADWPITYDDLEPFYEKAEWEIGVSGDDSTNPFKGARRKPLPMPPLPNSREHEILWAGALKASIDATFDRLPRPWSAASGSAGGRPSSWRPGGRSSSSASTSSWR